MPSLLPERGVEIPVCYVFIQIPVWSFDDCEGRRMNLRGFWVKVHRYAGLAMTVFLIIVGLTGSLLVFYSELEQVINPQFMDGFRSIFPC